MRTVDLNRRRINGLRSRLFGGRTSVQIVVGALAIAFIVLAFVLRPGQSAQEAKPAATPAPPAKATAVSPTAVPAVALSPAPTRAATTVPTPAPQERVHTVATGDTLSNLAQKYYGDSTKWKKIADANKDTVPDPDRLQLGQKLKIPD